MKRLFVLLSLLINTTFAQVYAPDPTFCFQPDTKIFESKLIEERNFLIPQSSNLKKQSSKPISFYDILTADSQKYYALSNHYAARFDLNGKIESEFSSPDTLLTFKKYFDKKLLVKRGNTSFIFSQSGVKEEKIPDVIWEGALDFVNRKVYKIDGDKVIRYNDYGKEETRFAHKISGLKELFVLSSGKFMAISETFSADTSFVFYKMYRMNIDGSIDGDFQPVDIRESFIGSFDYFNIAVKTFNVIELSNGNICVEHHYIITDGTKPIIKLINSKGLELTPAIKQEFFGGPYPIIYNAKSGSNNTIYYLSRYSTDIIKRWTAQATSDASFSTKGIRNLTAFEPIDSNTLLVADNEKIYKLSTTKQRFITLEVPEQIDIEGKPVFVKAIASDGSPIELSISGEGVLKDSVITWSKEGVGKITAKFKDSNCYSISSDFSIWEFHRLFLNDIPTKKTNSPPFDVRLGALIDTSLVKFEVSGEAYIIGNILYLKGKPGKVCVETIKTNPNNNVVIRSLRCFEVEAALITGVEQQSTDELVNIFPNPSIDGFYMKVNNPYKFDKGSTQLFDITGKSVSFELANDKEGVYYLKPNVNPTAGIYLLNFTLNGKRITKRLVIE